MKTKFYLILIFLLAFVVRIYAVDKVPPGLSNDEIAIAYNAYSVINTGRDGTGEFLPLSFKSNNDLRAPLYIYIAAPFIKILGNNEISARLPSVILGSLSCVALYYLVKELGAGRMVALLSSTLLAFSPWHIYFSRLAMEPNTALFFVLLGTWFFLLGLKKPFFFYLSALSFSLSLYAYHTERIFTPLLIALLIFVFRDKLKLYKKNLAVAGILFLVFTLPLLIDQVVHIKDSTRANTEIILKDYELAFYLKEKTSTFGKILVTFNFCIQKYLGYINPRHLFLVGLSISKDFSNFKLGLMELTCLPFFLIGLKKLWNMRTKFSKFNLIWLFMAPLTSSLTLGEINIRRNLVSIVPLVIIAAVGINIFSRNRKRLILVLTILLLNFIYFYYFYIFHFPKELAENWSYGYKQMAEYVGKNESKYKKIVIDPNYGTISYNLVGLPDIFILYFNKMNPKTYLSERYVKDDILYFSKYEIRKVDWPKEKIESKSLYVVAVHSTPVLGQNVKEVYSISLPNDDKAFKFYEGY